VRGALFLSQWILLNRASGLFIKLTSNDIICQCWRFMSDNKPSSQKPTNEGLPAGAERQEEIPPYVTEEIYRFWQQHGTRLMVYGAVFLIAVLGWQIVTTQMEGREDKLRESYATLETEAAQVAFAEDHMQHGLAGYTYLKKGKEAFEEGAYETALESYENASKSLEGTELEGWVVLGKAASLKRLGRLDESASILEATATNENFAEGIRAEAMFHCIVLALENDQQAIVDDYTTKLEAIDSTGRWIQRLRTIKMY